MRHNKRINMDHKMLRAILLFISGLLIVRVLR